MKLKLVDPLQLPNDLAERWRELQATNPGLSSPYFTLAFVQAIARSRPGVRVSVIDDGAAFFPFQHESFGFGVGRPVGSPMSDYHGLIAPAGCELDVREIVRRSGLMGWEFNHVPATQANFAKWGTKEAVSPIIELGQWTGGSGSAREQAARKFRKLEREVGKVTFEFDCRDRDVFDTCLRWKQEQYRRTGLHDAFADSSSRWIKDGLARLFEIREAELSGCLSVLRVDERPVAAHFGMRSRTDLHYWFPSYDPAVGNYSPGVLLLMKMADAAAAAGISRLDLGRGDARYKDQAATGVLPLIEGCVVVQPLAWKMLEARKGARRMARALVQRLKSGGDKTSAAPAEAG